MLGSRLVELVPQERHEVDHRIFLELGAPDLMDRELLCRLRQVARGRLTGRVFRARRRGVLRDEQHLGERPVDRNDPGRLAHRNGRNGSNDVVPVPGRVPHLRGVLRADQLKAEAGLLGIHGTGLGILSTVVNPRWREIRMLEDVPAGRVHELFWHLQFNRPTRKLLRPVDDHHRQLEVRPRIRSNSAEAGCVSVPHAVGRVRASPWMLVRFRRLARRHIVRVGSFRQALIQQRPQSLCLRFLPLVDGLANTLERASQGF